MSFWDFRVNAHNPQQKSIDLKLTGTGFTLQFEEDSQTDVTNQSYFNGGTAAGPGFYDPDAASDIYLGSQFSDRMVGDHWGNVFSGNDGNDFLYGEGGVDILYGDNGDDTIDGGADGDYIFGGNGNDKLIGDAGDDYIGGGAGQDTVSGGAGNDILDGEAGNDTMRGGDGADILTGGAGHDSLYAGLLDGDVDTFKFGADALGAGSADYIYEFVTGQDKFEIDLASGTGAVTLQDSGANTYAYVKGDFDGVADNGLETLSFVVVSNTTVTCSDFAFV